ncbi:outer membrane beta-barrel protein [Aquimarina intermedia]|uniref:Outer membrane protein with beta-barrel domain n=1 Tax=Aquimarina intermedia TaxID=350814 RepID=A0A5S5C6E4_9FLAO|nr:outer membrane beta-barrel protein [Aquimarina intermedia]TYP74985.1 outer membrane protein with beta-barrel domain [Aquimarina intermedia]
MKKNFLFICLAFVLSGSYAQYRWEVSGGATFSKLNLDNVDTNRGIGFYFNAGYGYMLDDRAKTSIIFSLEALQRRSTFADTASENIEINGEPFTVRYNEGDEIKAFQIGFSPKFRVITGQNTDNFRAFFQVGPSFRVNTKVENGDKKLSTQDYEQIVLGGVYGAGFSIATGEMFDFMIDVGVMNDFIDNLTDQNSKFFDIYARVGIRYRVYDARR